MNRTTTSLPVCSRAILRCTHPNAKCIIARQLPIYFLNFIKPLKKHPIKNPAIRGTEILSV